MFGTAIRNQTFGLPVRARRIAVGREGSRALVWAQRIARSLGKEIGRRDIRRGWLTAFFLMSFVIGTVVCGPAAHPWIDGDPAETAQTLVVKAPAAADAPAKHNAPAKGLGGAMCTGHCMSHSVSLPAPIIAAAVAPYVARAAWQVVNDQWTQPSSPARLERPPRV